MPPRARRDLYFVASTDNYSNSPEKGESIDGQVDSAAAKTDGRKTRRFTTNWTTKLYMYFVLPEGTVLSDIRKPPDGCSATHLWVIDSQPVIASKRPSFGAETSTVIHRQMTHHGQMTHPWLRTRISTY